MQTRILSVLAASALVAGTAFAQQAAPRDNPSVSLGGVEVAVEYGRPSLNGRPLAELLKSLPADRMWRTGSEQITTLTVEGGDLMVGGEKLAAGKYTLYVHCAEDGARSLAVNSVLGQPLVNIFAAAPDELKQEPWPHFDYENEIGDKEVLRVPLERTTGVPAEDRFKITLAPNDAGATMSLAWGDESWAVALAPGN